MSKLKHTPGPWKVYDENDYYPGVESIPCECSIIVYGEKYEYFSGVQGQKEEDGGTHEEFLANARLIAASPEMMEALIECIEWFKSYTDCRSSAAVKTKNIIEKATGLKIEEIINE